MSPPIRHIWPTVAALFAALIFAPIACAQSDAASRLHADYERLRGKFDEAPQGWRPERPASGALLFVASDQYTPELVPSDSLGDDRRKDYEQSPERHRELGTGELVIFDPHSREGRDRVRWQVYRRDGARSLEQLEASDSDRVRVEALGCFLRVLGEGPALRLRIATGPSGDDLYATDAERAERAEAEVARLAAELEALRRRR